MKILRGKWKGIHQEKGAIYTEGEGGLGNIYRDHTTRRWGKGRHIEDKVVGTF